jgi:hypothetical protein
MTCTEQWAIMKGVRRWSLLSCAKRRGWGVVQSAIKLISQVANCWLSSKTALLLLLANLHLKDCSSVILKLGSRGSVSWNSRKNE